jgi:DNA/RNA endonuclease G (NUC1)
VATSGDTGKAALEGFKDVPGTEIMVFYPDHGVSSMQKRQMATQEGANVGVCALDGNFDDCQNGVKMIFTDAAVKENLQLFDNKAAEAKKAEVQKVKTITFYEQPAPLTDRPEQILKRKGYTTSYNNKSKNPNWVAWHLTKAHTYGDHQRKNEVFFEDETIERGQRATDNDYYNSRYDRGHMCPAGDNKWDAQAMRESFLFTNICPQNHGLNKYEWNDLEIQCR